MLAQLPQPSVQEFGVWLVAGVALLGVVYLILGIVVYAKQLREKPKEPRPYRDQFITHAEAQSTQDSLKREWTEALSGVKEDQKAQEAYTRSLDQAVQTLTLRVERFRAEVPAEMAAALKPLLEKIDEKFTRLVAVETKIEIMAKDVVLVSKKLDEIKE